MANLCLTADLRSRMNEELIDENKWKMASSLEEADKELGGKYRSSP